jgi:fused signal recognition particle receptor
MTWLLFAIKWYLTMFKLFTKKPEPAADVLAQAPPEPKLNWQDRLKAGLAKTRQKLGSGLSSLLGGQKLDAATLEDLETALLSSDVGVAATQRLVDACRQDWKQAEASSTPKAVLKANLIKLLQPLEARFDVTSHKPYVIMIAGVNGAGKTTSIGKLAKLLQSQGHSVLLAAGDTFRAAAREQLAIWGERNHITVIQQSGGDAAAVMFDAVQAATARGIDVVIADTAGRLPTQLHLMEELKKSKRVLDKALPGAPHETLLVLDGNTGQNALAQVKAFDAALKLTGLIMTKLDGTARGGVIAAIAAEHPVPLKFIGVGEQIDDLRAFAAKDFVDALLDD